MFILRNGVEYTVFNNKLVPTSSLRYSPSTLFNIAAVSCINNNKLDKFGEYLVNNNYREKYAAYIEDDIETPGYCTKTLLEGKNLTLQCFEFLEQYHPRHLHE